MPALYVYLISSLPMLDFGMRPPLAWEDFLELCQPLIPADDYAVVKNLPEAEQYSGLEGKIETIRRWVAFDTALRNELVKVRSGRQHIEAAKYLRPLDYSNFSLAQAVMSAQRNPAPQEAERLLDRERWDFLEELSLGHYFDLTFLILYAYKLKILWRWEDIRRADKTALLAEVLA
jgi:hypothetical protein